MSTANEHLDAVRRLLDEVNGLSRPIASYLLGDQIGSLIDSYEIDEVGNIEVATTVRDGDADRTYRIGGAVVSYASQSE